MHAVLVTGIGVPTEEGSLGNRNRDGRGTGEHNYVGRELHNFLSNMK